MEQSNKEPNQFSEWSELCPDLLRCVFKRLSFTNLERAKLVCRWWNYVSRGSIPKPIPCLILFPPKDETTSHNSCVLFVPDDRDEVYKTRDLGLGFAQSYCLATYGSWFLMVDHLWNLYIVNPLSLERMNLPHRHSIFAENFKQDLGSNRACLWIDDTTKDYLVVWTMDNNMVFTKRGDYTWRNNLPGTGLGKYEQIVYNHKDHKVYTRLDHNRVFVWDFSGDIPIAEGYLLSLDFSGFNTVGTYGLTIFKLSRYIATTVSGHLLHVDCIKMFLEPWEFHVCKLDTQGQRWVEIDSLGDEALILDIGYTVVANDITGINRSSIYFTSYPHQIFVYDLTTGMKKHLPEEVFSSVPSSNARWFFPGFTG